MEPSNGVRSHPNPWSHLGWWQETSKIPPPRSSSLSPEQVSFRVGFSGPLRWLPLKGYGLTERPPPYRIIPVAIEYGAKYAQEREDLRAASRLRHCNSHLGHSYRRCSTVSIAAPQSRQRGIRSVLATFSWYSPKHQFPVSTFTMRKVRGFRFRLILIHRNKPSRRLRNLTSMSSSNRIMTQLR